MLSSNNLVIAAATASGIGAIIYYMMHKPAHDQIGVCGTGGNEKDVQAAHKREAMSRFVQHGHPVCDTGNTTPDCNASPVD